MKVEVVASDFTGTVSRDGEVPGYIATTLKELSKLVRVVFLTADTHGKAREALADLNVEVEIVSTGADKPGRIEEFGINQTVVIGNGHNDIPMFEVARFGIAVMYREGLAGDLLGLVIRKCWPVVSDPVDAFNLLLKSEGKRLYATTRD